VLANAFGPNSIALETEQLEFQAAVKKAVELLVLDGRATAGYIDEVLQSLQNLGPYFVVAPGIALAHAAPSESVLEVGFSLLHLSAGVISGSDNDPVRLLFAFCSPNADAHIELLGTFAQTISSPGKINLLLNASAGSVIRSLL
jgi:mannitol/fructose-specific phosphotransferase system IIA component (Ntr-type)